MTVACLDGPLALVTLAAGDCTSAQDVQAGTSAFESLGPDGMSFGVIPGGTGGCVDEVGVSTLSAGGIKDLGVSMRKTYG